MDLFLVSVFIGVLTLAIWKWIKKPQNFPPGLNYYKFYQLEIQEMWFVLAFCSNFWFFFEQTISC